MPAPPSYDTLFYTCGVAFTAASAVALPARCKNSDDSEPAAAGSPGGIIAKTEPWSKKSDRALFISDISLQPTVCWPQMLPPSTLCKFATVRHPYVVEKFLRIKENFVFKSTNQIFCLKQTGPRFARHVKKLL